PWPFPSRARIMSGPMRRWGGSVFAFTLLIAAIVHAAPARALTPNDPLFDPGTDPHSKLGQWNLASDGRGISADTAWDTTTGEGEQRPGELGGRAGREADGAAHEQLNPASIRPAGRGDPLRHGQWRARYQHEPGSDVGHPFPATGHGVRRSARRGAGRGDGQR